MPREGIGEGVRVGDRCANTGPSVYGYRSVLLTVRRRLTLDEAERGDLPKPFSAEEWAAMACASRAPVA